MYVSSADTIFVNDTSVDLSSIAFSAGPAAECSCACVTVLAAPIRYFTVEGSAQSAERSGWTAFQQDLYVQYISSSHSWTPGAWVFLPCGSGTVSHGWQGCVLMPEPLGHQWPARRVGDACRWILVIRASQVVA